MAYEEVAARSESDGYEEREKVRMEFGTELEGRVARLSERRPSSKLPDSEYRYVDLDSVDGRKLTFSADKILLEKLDEARVQPGDSLKVVIEKRVSKKTGNDYRYPRVFVDRGAGVARAEAAEVPSNRNFDEPPF